MQHANWETVRLFSGLLRNAVVELPDEEFHVERALIVDNGLEVTFADGSMVMWSPTIERDAGGAKPTNRHSTTLDQRLAAFRMARDLAACTKDGEIVDGQEFVLENDDAVDTLHAFISEARQILGVE